MGTPEIAVPTLEKLNEKYKIEAVVTVPDKPKGRGLQLLPSPVKEKALQLGLKVLQPENLKENNFINQIAEISPDIIVVFAFRILPTEVYKLAKIASFNIHTSLLPKYRGAAPINWAIINGEKISGLTSFILNDKVDTGSILLQKQVDIPPNWTAGELYNLLMENAPLFAVDTCELLFSGDYKLLPQDNSLATPAPKIFKQTAKIDWTKNANEVVNFINGHSPTPCAWTLWNNSQLKIFLASIFSDNFSDNEKAGSFFISENRFIIHCGRGAIEILELQQEGKKKIKTTDFINGFRGNTEGNFD
jgi:methionyl-tRNA formyltransferase